MNPNCFFPRNAAKILFVCAASAIFAGASPARSSNAAEGDPVAVRVWPEGTVTVESHWGLSLKIKNESPRPAESVSGVEAVTAEIPATDATVSVGESGEFVLRRPANQSEPTWQSTPPESVDKSETPHDIDVKLLSDNGVLVELDGLVLLVPGPGCTTEMIQSFQRIDAVIGSNLSRFAADNGQSLPSNVRNWISESPTTMDSIEIRTQTHNTVALSSTVTRPEKKSPSVWWDISPEPWQMSNAVNKMFTAMERSCSASQDVFSELTADQMNFKPANGTHTPRWNVEHMMGRQLLFFSQIYHAAEPAIPVMDLNPAQMPPDYRFAHPEWTGAEEARQMQRVSDFSRRFAYLLDGFAVDEKVPGSRWPTLGALLKQMERHYSEHTANTQKKFELPGWPANR
ncbi:MAG: DinB family protein [Rhodopirellula sp. JB055]|uniref:DinB family protein n=1 Tax=Rhodopirellula sp. JB055 TaxID=3342846 RepID=UPI00370BA93A